MKSTLNILITIGLILGGVLGMAGSLIAQANLRAAFWGIDGVGVIVATALLTLKFHRAGNDLVAGGFLVYTLGESIMLTGTPGTLQASVPAFGAGVALWSAGLLLVSIPRTYAIWARATGVISAVLFAIVAAQVFWGVPLDPITKPLPGFAYPFLVLTFLGWIMHTLKSA